MTKGIISKRASSGKIKNGIWCVKMKSNYSKLQRKLSASKKAKEKNNWSRESGAGFIAQDIIDIVLIDNELLIKYSWGSQLIPVKELNLRETEEALKYVLGKLEPKYVGDKA